MTRRITLVFAATLLLATSVFAVPEYAVRYNQTCALCHYNPTGGGMRTLYGAQFFSYTDLPMNKLSFDEVDRILPKAADNLQYGLDMRTLYVLRHGANSTDSQEIQSNEFVLMQADAYLSYAFTDATRAVVDISNNGIEEAFVMHSAADGHLQVRAGKFRSTFGWGFTDHTLFVRRFLGYGGLQGAGPRTYDTGAELGFYSDRIDITLGITNGVPGNTGNDLYIRSARRFALGDATATLGATGRWLDVGKGGNLLWQAGSHYGFTLGKFGFLGETDAYLYAWGQDDMMAVVSTHQLRWRFKRGLFLNSWYEYYDKDIDRASGYSQRVRIGLDMIPHGYMAISPIYEYTLDDPSTDKNYGQFLVQLHLWL